MTFVLERKKKKKTSWRKGENAEYEHFSISHNVSKRFFFKFVKSQECMVKGAGYQHFLLFRKYFQKFSFLGSLKVGNVWKSVLVTSILSFSENVFKMFPF